jgi:hypothetical protein
MKAWWGWYHVNGNTYGTWLRGDPRGWRARHHREHVDGDYKDPPAPGTYDRLLVNSRRLMTRDAVRLSGAAKRLACQTMIGSLRRNGIEVIALSVDDHHFHLLARFPRSKPTDRPGPTRRAKAPNFVEPTSTGKHIREPADPWASTAPKRKDGNVELAIIRHLVGVAKKDAARELVAAGLAPAGGVWAKRCRALAIKERDHQISVYRYIVAHGGRGAEVWTYRDGERSNERET